MQLADLPNSDTLLGHSGTTGIVFTQAQLCGFNTRDKYPAQDSGAHQLLQAKEI